ncbi:glucosamine-6-phosphate deaminase [Scopulibacillus darangshiensis]|uniref:Glucosamine-6-phosphate deaminase n=1 Tax=Scopulibacillus darangshiensis TaxID=442528 RepID=A0A4R2P7U5_9BACL|nr:glucosamine-6-phosphate deaminase [Scopulibacillus darangshiensis]TCP30973.1 glucosamine-6-phosphate deaminase [Scopulibacillus darangshiensis]
MELITVSDYAELSNQCALMIKKFVDEKPDASIVLAMGNTPLGTYEVLTEMKKRGEFDPSQLTIYQLDGYLGLEPSDPRSLEGWLRKTVIEPWGILESQFVKLPENSDHPEAVCLDYETKVKEAGGFDLAVLGLGPNGHLGFNEPPSSAFAPTRVVPLTKESLISNAIYWGGMEHVPTMSMTAGMNLLLSSCQIILLVNGGHKKEIFEQTLRGKIDDSIPSSHLQSHGNVKIIADKLALPGEVAK